MINLLHSKAGISHVKTVVLVLIFAMIFSAVLTYTSMMTVIQTSRDNTIRVLDSFVMHNSKEIYDSLKSGSDFSQSLDQVFYKSSLLSEFSLDNSGNIIYSKDEQGDIVYLMTNPNVSYDYNNTLKLKASYTIWIPVRFAGKLMTYLRIPITVRSYYSLKYN
ncbi:MAG: hypothetical protein PHV32_13980 [Eubacteriales bacterium]|nr:hypothetical protein [Eubacteriales bacterium]HCA29805.1 hypothetical protein [Oscillospiraceae bacterium]